ncbi:MAG: ABC transporter substrate-binding protein [Thermomicrobiales bacterium]
MKDARWSRPVLSTVSRRGLFRVGAGATGAGLFAAGAPGLRRAASAQASGEVNFWHVWGGDREPIIEQVIADFHAANPDIQINHTVLSQQGMYEKYLTAIAGGDPPDVMMIHSREMPNFADKNSLMALDELVARDELDLAATFYAADVDSQYWNDELFALPLATTGANFLLFWNKDHFQEVGLDPETPPTTWTQFAEYAAQLTKKDGDDVERVGALFWYLDNNHWQAWSFLNSGTLFSDDAKQVLWSQEENTYALNWMKSNLDELYGGYDQIRAFATTPGAGGTEANQSWFAGQLSMHVIGVWHFLQLSTEAPDLNYSVANMPVNDQNPESELAGYADGAWGYNIPRGAQNVDAAWEWIKYTCLGEGQRTFFKAQGRPSVVPEYNEDPEYAEANPHWPVVQRALASAKNSPTTPVYPQVRSIMDQMVEEALVGVRSVEDALAWGTEEAQKLQDEFFAS